MERTRWERIQELYHAARGMSVPERAELLAERCGADADLRAHVEELLAEGVGDPDSGEPTRTGSGPRREADPGSDLGSAPGGTSATSLEHVSATDLAETVRPQEVVGSLSARGGASDRYEKRGEVARGGQGAVLRVWDSELRRDLAMKVMRASHVAGPSTEAGPGLGRFIEEAQVTGQLDHPGIVPVHDLGLDADGRVFFTMKLIKGESLAAILEKARDETSGWTRTRVLGVLSKVCEAMAYAHHKGVVHRDLKPANIMVGRFGEVYVMDWGLARVLDREDTHDVRVRPLDDTATIRSDRSDDRSVDGSAGAPDGGPQGPLETMDGDVLGTPAYMSPEQALGHTDEIGPQSDVYSAGAILYELLAGHAPYCKPGMRLTPHAVWYRAQEGPPDPLHTRTQEVPTELLAICERAMARDPGDRYPDMSALARDVAAFLEHRVVSAYETGALAEARKWVERNRALAAALAAVLLVLVVGLGTTVVLRQQALASAALANENARIAQERAEDVLSLSASEQVEQLRARLEQLWPPHPRHLAAYEQWEREAERVVAGLDTDGTDVGHRARLAALRAKALPPGSSAADAREAARRAHPRYPELDPLTRRVASLRAAQAVRSGRADPEVVELDRGDLPDHPIDVLSQVIPLVVPRRTEFGREAEALAMARIALSEVSEDVAVSWVSEVLAWACLANGLDGEARAAMQTALDVAPEEMRAKVQGAQAILESHLEAVEGERGHAALQAAEQDLAELEAVLSAARVWEFASEDDHWWHGQLARLIAEIEALADPVHGPWRGVAPERGWSIQRRRAWAASVGERTVSGSEVAARWHAARERVAANPRYRGLHLEPQLGLVPLGPDPESGFEEFGHPLTGDVPERDEHGRLAPRDEDGLVFVLLPGGDFWMGAQAEGTRFINYFPKALSDESPVHGVTLSPFFLSKYEMSQGQWLRFSGENPSYLQPRAREDPWEEAVSLAHPLELVSWERCAAVLDRMGLVLPSEAQWEYAARGGTSTPWWSGEGPESLQGAGNVVDSCARIAGMWVPAGAEDWLDDGWAGHAPIGSYAPNPFGLHDVNGNVGEWCLDAYEERYYDVTERLDPVCDPRGGPRNVIRGGSFLEPAVSASSSARRFAPPTASDQSLGVRPARVLEFGGQEL